MSKNKRFKIVKSDLSYEDKRAFKGLVFLYLASIVFVICAAFYTSQKYYIFIAALPLVAMFYFLITVLVPSLFAILRFKKASEGKLIVDDEAVGLAPLVPAISSLLALDAFLGSLTASPYLFFLGSCAITFTLISPLFRNVGSEYISYTSAVSWV